MRSKFRRVLINSSVVTLDGGDEVLAVAAADGVDDALLVGLVLVAVREDLLNQLVEIRVGPGFPVRPSINFIF